MASSPSFDPNRVEDELRQISGSRPTVAGRAAPESRERGALYVPGSTFKVITASAALESKKFTPESTFFDPGYCTVYGKR